MPNPDPLAIEAFVESASALLAMPLEGEHRAIVVATLQRIGAFAEDVASRELGDDIEVAGIFTP